MSVIDELNHPGAQELLRTQPLVRVAYTGPDGFPRVIPIGFWWDGERVVVHTAPNAPKVRALAARPQVALTIDTEVPPHRAHHRLQAVRAHLCEMAGDVDSAWPATARRPPSPPASQSSGTWWSALPGCEARCHDGFSNRRGPHRRGQRDGTETRPGRTVNDRSSTAVLPS
jgi:Pyridoxamine 5'-phosphate oxidase